MSARPVITGETAASCYFRMTVDHPHRKALIQVCEPCNELCNESCEHCFVSATERGAYMPLGAIRDRLIHRLAEARVNRVTITGGEPFMHADLIRIVAERPAKRRLVRPTVRCAVGAHATRGSRQFQSLYHFVDIQANLGK